MMVTKPFRLIIYRSSRRRYATLRGISNTVASVMGCVTPWLAGWIYDTTGSYAWLVIPSSVVTAIAGLIMWYLPSRRLV